MHSLDSLAVRLGILLIETEGRETAEEERGEKGSSRQVGLETGVELVK